MKEYDILKKDEKKTSKIMNRTLIAKNNEICKLFLLVERFVYYKHNMNIRANIHNVGLFHQY